MSTITIQSTVLPNFRFSPTPTAVYLRVYLLSPFMSSAGIALQASVPDDKAWYKQVTCSLATNSLTIPSFTLDSTADGLDNTNARYGCYFYDQTGRQLKGYDSFTSFRLSHLTTPASWSDIRAFNFQRIPVVDNTSYTKLETEALISAHGGIPSINDLTGAITIATGTSGTNFAAAASGSTITLNLPDAGASSRGAVTTGAQTIAGIKTFTGATVFISVPAADPGQGNSALATLFRGADSTSAAPLSSNEASTDLQTIRTGGTHGVAMFGFKLNFQLTGVAAADTYADYLISRVSPDMTGAPTGEYYHLARRNYIIMRPTNFGSSSVVGYGAWNQGEVQLTGCAAFGTQTDCNNLTGSDMAHEDFSSKFKGACVATNTTSNANYSAIFYSQGASGTAAYKGWKVAPNATIRHILDFSDAYYTISGTVAVTNGSGAIVGTGTKFLTDLVKGDQVQFLGVPYTITVITDNTHATVSPVYAGSTTSGLTVAKYVTPLRMAPMCYITAYNGALDFRFAGLDANSQWQIDPDGRAVTFGGIVQVPSPLQIGGNTDSEVALKRTGTQLQIRTGGDSFFASIAAAYYRSSEANITLSNGDNNDISIGTAGSVRFSGPSGAYAITGFTGGEGGRRLVIYNVIAQACTIKVDTGSTTANRIYTLANGANTNVSIAGYGAAVFEYSSVDSRWVLISVNN